GRAADRERRPAGLAEHQGEARAAILRPRPHDDLSARRRPDRHEGGLDERLKGEAPEGAERLGVLDDRIRAGVDQLRRAVVLALDRRRQTHGLEARAARHGFAAYEYDELGAVTPWTVEGSD